MLKHFDENFVTFSLEYSEELEKNCKKNSKMILGKLVLYYFV